MLYKICSLIALSKLRLTSEEKTWLKKVCPYLKDDYLDYLSSYSFRPREQVKIDFIPDQASEQGDLSISVEGTWSEVILYEVPLMSIVSQVYFTTMDLNWTLRGQRVQAKRKGEKLINSGIRFSEFGTRRRRSYRTQKLVMEGLLEAEREVSATSSNNEDKDIGKVVGTSNVHFAMMFNLNPIGTVAHEWTMGIAALQGYDHSNLRSLELWDQIYSPPNYIPNSPSHDLTIALTDTFSTRIFWQDLLGSQSGKEIAKRWRGLRQDSGDSKTFAKLAKEEYLKFGIDPMTKVVIYSDSLNVEKCIDLARYSKEIGIGCSFGVGTHFTNDFIRIDGQEGDKGDPNDESILSTSNAIPSKALNIVIKLSSVNGRNAVKISDDLTKNTGDPEEVKICKRRFGIIEGEDHIEDA